MIVYLYTMYLISKLLLYWILILQFWKGLWWGNSKKKTFWNLYQEEAFIFCTGLLAKWLIWETRFVTHVINHQNGKGGGCNCNFCLITTCLGSMWGTPGVLCWNKYTYSLWFTLGRELWECHGPTVNVFSLRIWGSRVAMLTWNGWNCHTRIL